MRRCFTTPLWAALFSLLAACSRRADIVDEPDGGLVTRNPTPFLDAGLMPVDAGLDPAALVPCGEREYGGACRGANDFPCRFLPWVTDVATACQSRTGCRTNGLLQVQMGQQGCVASLSMSEPDVEFARCAFQEFSSMRCECGPQTAEVYLGVGNDGCSD